MLVKGGRKREEEWLEKYAPPSLLASNFEAWELYMDLRYQVVRYEREDEKKKERTIVTEINVVAIRSLMGIFGVKQAAQRAVYEKIRFIERCMAECRKRYG